VLRCQPEARGADKASMEAIDAHMDDEKHRDHRATEVLVPAA
jgi:hypothetical protein